MVDVFRGLLGDTDPQVRRAAVEALLQAGGPVASEALRAAALDPDAAVRRAALDGLGIFGGGSRGALDYALLHGDEATRASAAELAEPLSRRDPGPEPVEFGIDSH